MLQPASYPRQATAPLARGTRAMEAAEQLQAQVWYTLLTGYPCLSSTTIIVIIYQIYHDAVCVGNGCLDLINYNYNRI